MSDHPEAPVLAKADGPRWSSGASGEGVLDGSFGRWRGRPVTIAGTWNDNVESHAEQWSLRNEFASWQGDLDNAIGGIYKNRGETWAAAARGAYDDRWSVMLEKLAELWRDRTGTLCLRFSHEFNGDWYPWSVTNTETDHFRSAWFRFRTLQTSILPRAKMVFCANSDSSRSLDLDWREAFPGTELVDVMAVDHYNQYPFITSIAQFDAAIMQVDDRGAPHGLEQHRLFAESRGLPFAVSEWSSNAAMGDSPEFMHALHAWFSDHAGPGPGQLVYEIEFNVAVHGNRYLLYPHTDQPAAALAYRTLWARSP